MGLGAVMAALVEVELGRTFVPFRFGGEADNILVLADETQAGKTTMLNCLVASIPGGDRVISAEEAFELAKPDGQFAQAGGERGGDVLDTRPWARCNSSR